MNGEYITARLLPEVIRHLCARQGISYTSFSDNWLLRLEKDSQVHWAFGYQFDINNAASLKIAEEKVATFLALDHAGIPAIPHYLAKSVADDEPDWSLLQQLTPDVAYVTKPLAGSGGKHISMHTSLDEAASALRTSPLEAIAISPWYDIVSEVRLIVLDGTILLAYEKTNAQEKDGLRYFNLGHGAEPRVFTPSAEESRMALASLAACSLRLGAVDIAICASGERLVMEVNSGIMLENFARNSPENLKITEEIYKKILVCIFA